MTTGLQPTTRSENRFERWDLDQIRAAATEPGEPGESRHSIHGGGDGALVLTPTTTSLVITDQRGRRNDATGAVVEIHGADLWVFIVGMIWRSYRDGAVPLTRLNTDTYLAALDTFEAAIAEQTIKP